MRGSPRGSQNLEISSGSPPEWGGGVLGEFISGQDRYRLIRKFPRASREKTTEIFLFTLRNSKKNLRPSRGNLSKSPLNAQNFLHASRNLLLRILRANCQFVSFSRKNIKILWYHKVCFTREARDFLLIFQG